VRIHIRFADAVNGRLAEHPTTERPYFLRTTGFEPWLDHWETAIYEGKEFLKSEPYPMNRDSVDQLLASVMRSI
jgi:hypothetical protein